MDSLIRGARLFCQNPNFQAFLAKKSGMYICDPDDAKGALYRVLGIASCHDLSSDPEAGAGWYDLLQEYNEQL